MHLSINLIEMLTANNGCNNFQQSAALLSINVFGFSKLKYFKLGANNTERDRDYFHTRNDVWFTDASKLNM